ncbi:hypothetical protein SELMODRAFT_430727 [Selaginella moellendorffii]|uniref:Uncharacterized protein n=1 Tax=Selaginella moellendorffii TaxID=88036 RepID=D8TAB6_SELML|nr:hypothetical protein SELMODRAFT_430727 [Selaginella moellendorffii]
MRCAVSGRPTRRDVDAGSFFSEKGNKTPLVDDSDHHQFVACNGKILDFWHFDRILKACNVVDGVVVLELPYNVDEEEAEEEEEEDQEEKSKQEGGANTVPDEKQEEEEEVGDDRILVPVYNSEWQKLPYITSMRVKLFTSGLTTPSA